MCRSTPYFQNGLTLLELTVVLLILIGLGGLLLPFFGGTSQYAQCAATETTLKEIRNAIMGSFDRPGYFEDMAGLPQDIRGLRLQTYCLEDETLTSEGACTGGGNSWIEQPPFNPVTRRGWNGPYLSNAMQDAYHLNDIVLQIPSVSGADDCVDIDPSYTQQDCARLISIGPDETLQTLLTDADGSDRNDDQLLYLFIPDPNPAASCTEVL